MSTSPQLTPNPAAAILPVVFVILLISALLFLAFSTKVWDLSGYFKSIQNQLESFSALLNDSPSPTAALLPIATMAPTTPTSTKPKATSTPTHKPVEVCYRLNIREGEFASNKCYSKTNYDNLIYYLQRFDSANFDLQTAQGSISITCNCRNQQECDFFKDNCSQAQQQKSQAESNITKYRSMIKSIISQGK